MGASYRQVIFFALVAKFRLTVVCVMGNVLSTQQPTGSNGDAAMIELLIFNAALLLISLAVD